jgi:exodeoxyribonuclease VII large subunit
MGQPAACMMDSKTALLCAVRSNGLGHYGPLAPVYRSMSHHPSDPAWSVPAESTVWSVGGLLQAVADALQARFNPVTVSGEISGHARAASGHSYFTLKDAQGQLRCAMFRRAVQASPLTLVDGLRVQARGRLDVYGPRGELQLVVDSVRPFGQGSLYEQFLRLKESLAAEGLFDASRKRPLPAWPRHIGLVTSPDAAALRDVVSTLQRRVPHLPVLLLPSPVQGEQAPEALCRALDLAYARHHQHGECDVLLLVRGGGSIEDLWAFNSPLLVRKWAQAPMPVICGVGHETDFTLADFVADLRAPTPTAAAELCAPERDAQVLQLARLSGSLQDALARGLDRRAQRLDRLAERLGRPSGRLAQERTRLAAAAAQTQSALRRSLERRRDTLQRLHTQLPQALQRHLQGRHTELQQVQARLALLDPRLVLQRGYAWLSDAEGRPLSHVAQAQPGQPVQAELMDGRLQLTVQATRP